MDLHAPRLDLREVEDVIDQRQEMIGADQDLTQVVVIARRQDVFGAPHHQAGETDDGIHRRPELMGHIGQKLRFVARSEFELAVGLFQLLGALSHPGFQLFGMLSDLLVEFGVLNGDRRLIRQGAQELSVLVAKPLRNPAVHIEDADHRATRFQRHCHGGTETRFLHDLQEGTIAIFLQVVAHHDAAGRSPPRARQAPLQA